MTTMNHKPLTPRELQYAQALATGERPCEISRRWGVSKNALNSYQARACEKLGLYNRHQLALWAYRQRQLAMCEAVLELREGKPCK